MDITTPALLFPAISLLLLAFTSRFLTLAQLIRQLAVADAKDADLVAKQIPGLKRRIGLIKYMQTFGVLSFLLCALAMLAIFSARDTVGEILFGLSIVALAVSLVLSLAEVVLSTQALSVVVDDLEGRMSRAP